MPSITRSYFWLVTLSVSALAFGLASLGSGGPTRSDLRPIKASTVLVQASTGLDLLARNPLALPPSVPLSKQHALPSDQRQQFHFLVPHSMFDDGGLVLVLPVAGGKVNIFANGVPVSQSKEQAHTGPGLSSENIVALLPQKTLGADVAVIDLILAPNNSDIGIPSIWLGPKSSYEAAIAWMARWHGNLRFFPIVTAVLALLSGCVGLSMHGDRLVFVGALAGGAGLGSWLTGTIFRPEWASFGVFIGIVLLGIGAAMSIAGGLRQKNIAGAIVVGGALASLGGTVIGLVLTFVDVIMMAPVHSAYLATTLHGPWLGLALPIFVASNIRQMTHTLALARADKARLASLIEKQEADLQLSLRDRAVAEERQRFVRDIHDGIGGQLLSLLTRVRMGRVGIEDVASEIQEGISDLRLVVDSLDSVGSNLDEALSNFRIRAAQQLDAVGIQLRWDQPTGLNHLTLDARDLLNLYRILQEALSNCVRHSGAKMFAVAIDKRASGPGLVFVIGDDGRGFDPKVIARGQGLNSMSARAKQIGALLSLEPMSETTGSRIVIDWPFKP
jgi:signal transduction histidine kinase